MTSDTISSKTARIEVIQTGSRRRWTDEEKLRIVEESYAYRRGRERDGAPLRTFLGPII